MTGAKLTADHLFDPPGDRKRVGTNTLRRGAGVCWTWDMDMPDLPVIGKRCSRPGTPTR